MTKKNVKRKILLVIIGLLLLVGVIIRISIKKEPVIKTINISGVIVDVLTNQGLADLNIRVANDQYKTNTKGEFKINNVYDNDELIINGNGLYENVTIPIAGQTRFEIRLNSKLLETFRNLESYEKNRQYKKLYRLLSYRLQKQYSEEEYVNLKNQWRDKTVEKNNYRYFQMETVRSSVKTKGKGRIVAEIKYQWSKDKKKWEENKKSVNFILEQERWVVDGALM